MVTVKFEQEIGILASESAISFATGSTVLPFWAFSAVGQLSFRLIGAMTCVTS